MALKSIKELPGRRQIVVPQYVKLIEEELNKASDPDQKKIMTAYLTAFRYTFVWLSGSSV